MSVDRSRSSMARRRIRILGIELGAFLLLGGAFAGYALDTDGGALAAKRILRVVLTSVGVTAGPMSGAIARDGQRCCLDFSWRLILPCGSMLLAGILVQCLPARSRFAAGSLLLAWALGWLAWFGGAILSLLHALE